MIEITITSAMIDAACEAFDDAHDKYKTCDRALIVCTDAYPLAMMAAIHAALLAQGEQA